MNIRNVSHPIIPAEVQKAEVPRQVKTESGSEDRDPQGQSHREEPSRNPLNEEEMKKAQEYLEKLTGLKTNGLNIEIEIAGEIRVFLIKDHDGRVVRRIPEWELRGLIQDQDKKTGQIFDKAA